MKTLHTDREPVNSNPTDVKVDAGEFLEKIKGQKPIDLNPANSPVPIEEPKKSKGWLWVLVIVLIVILIISIKVYLDKKKQLNNG